MARFRPQRHFRTDVLYYYGVPGTGKTTTINSVLNTIRTLYPKADYYCKLGGLSKFWDGYDNQPICWLDDPCSPAVARTGDEEPIQRLKNVFSTGEVLVEVKHGSMVFDSSLVILSCNFDPRDLAQACGSDSRDAMYTDTCGAYEIDTRVAAVRRLPVHLTKMIARNLEQFDITIDVDTVIKKLPEFKAVQYADIPLLSACNLSEYV